MRNKTVFCLIILIGLLSLSLQLAGQVSSNVWGNVTDQDSGEPIAQATVFLYPIQDDELRFGYRGAPLETKTNAAGGYLFQEVPAGTYCLRVEKDGFAPSLPDFYYGEHWVHKTEGNPPPYFSKYFTSKVEVRKYLEIFDVNPGQIINKNAKLNQAGEIQVELDFLLPDGTTKRFNGLCSLYRKRDAAESFTSEEWILLQAAKAGEELTFRNIAPAANLFVRVSVALTDKDIFFENVAVVAGQKTVLQKTVDYSRPTGVSGTIKVRGKPAKIASLMLLYHEGTKSMGGWIKMVENTFNWFDLKPGPGRYTLYCTAIWWDKESKLEFEEKVFFTVEEGKVTRIDLDLGN